MHAGNHIRRAICYTWYNAVERFTHSEERREATRLEGGGGHHERQSLGAMLRGFLFSLASLAGRVPERSDGVGEGVPRRSASEVGLSKGGGATGVIILIVQKLLRMFLICSIIVIHDSRLGLRIIRATHPYLVLYSRGLLRIAAE
jgi:hypothetical protein